MLFLNSSPGFCSKAFIVRVAVEPGAGASPRMPLGPWSMATFRVMPASAELVCGVLRVAGDADQPGAGRGVAARPALVLLQRVHLVLQAGGDAVEAELHHAVPDRAVHVADRREGTVGARLLDAKSQLPEGGL
ncbi:hypothetical protein ACFXPE_26990 [Streptomyces scopuliridis]|uniref:hypothetical protein n=1 Tax=Streptomyces scopuliridis TaxID=452529 RepID=UPI0036C1C3BF